MTGKKTGRKEILTQTNHPFWRQSIHWINRTFSKRERVLSCFNSCHIDFLDAVWRFILWLKNKGVMCHTDRNQSNAGRRRKIKEVEFWLHRYTFERHVSIV